ncbi:MAG TPA: PAS domain S-box protein [Burkholderiaceae bacterium]
MDSNQPSEQAELLLFKAIVEQTPDAIIFADCDGMIRVWNRGAEVVFGFSAAEVIGSSLDIIIQERFRRAHWEGFRNAIESGHTRHGGDVRTTRSNHKLGHKLYVDLSFGLVTSEAGSVIGSVAVGRDCTARHLSDKALRDRLAEFERQAS